MKNRTSSKKVITAVLGFTFLTISAHSASFVVSDVRAIASQDNTAWGAVSGNENVNYYVSVNSSNPGYAGIYANDSGGNAVAPWEVDITEAIQGWQFVGGGSNALNVSSESGGLITMTTTDTSFDSFQQSSPRLWIANDPGSDLTTPATGSNSSPGGYRGIGDVSGSIDISGLASGTIYFFYGAYNSTPSISASMVGTGNPDINLANFHNGDNANRKEMYAAAISFVNDSGYDSIDYDFTAPNGRWGGIVVAGSEIPEPTLATLFGLSALTLLVRRRR